MFINVRPLATPGYGALVKVTDISHVLPLADGDKCIGSVIFLSDGREIHIRDSVDDVETAISFKQITNRA